MWYTLWNERLNINPGLQNNQLSFPVLSPALCNFSLVFKSTISKKHSPSSIPKYLLLLLLNSSEYYVSTDYYFYCGHYDDGNDDDESAQSDEIRCNFISVHIVADKLTW